MIGRRGLGLMLLAAVALGTAWSDARAAGCEGETRSRADALLGEARALFADRIDEQTRQALSKVEQAAKLCPEDGAALTLLSQLEWAVGESLPGESKADKQTRLEYFERGEAAADRLLALEPGSVDGLYWKTANMASGADMKGWASSLWLFPTLLQNMEKVDELSPHFLYGGTDRFWVEVMCRVPLWLTSKFGYDLEKDVIAPLEEEIKAEPRYLANYVYLAKICWKAGQENKDEQNQQKALANLRLAIEGDPGALDSERGDNRVHQELARRMWKEYTGKDFPER